MSNVKGCIKQLKKNVCKSNKIWKMCSIPSELGVLGVVKRMNGLESSKKKKQEEKQMKEKTP